MKITKTQLKQIIKEELAVILTNEEAGELFGEAIEAELEEKKHLKVADGPGKGKDNMGITHDDKMVPNPMEEDVLQEDLSALAGLLGTNPQELKAALQGLAVAVGNVAGPGMLAVAFALAMEKIKGGKDVDAAVRDAAEDVKQKSGKL